MHLHGGGGGLGLEASHFFEVLSLRCGVLSRQLDKGGEVVLLCKVVANAALTRQLLLSAVGFLNLSQLFNQQLNLLP